MRCCAIALFLLAGVACAAPVYIAAPMVQESAAEQAANLERNRTMLHRLQNAAENCCRMRLVLAESEHARMRRPVPLAELTTAEVTQMKRILAMLQPVKSAPAGDFAAQHVVTLELLGQGDTVLATVDYMDVAPEGMVNPQGYAPGARYMLSGHATMAWHLLMRADYARSIAQNPAPTRLRSQPTKLYKVPEPPRKIEKPAFEEKRYYHTDCKDDHKGHKHKRKDHYCDHPQRK